MDEYYVTFGNGQYGGTLKYHYIKFNTDNEELVRDWMNKHYFQKYAMIYTNNEFSHQVDDFGLKRLCEINIGMNIQDYTIRYN